MYKNVITTFQYALVPALVFACRPVRFLPRDAMLARYMLWACVSLSICVCVCLTQVGVLLKRLNVGSRKQHRTIAQGI